MTDSQQIEAETRALLSDWPSVLVQRSGGGWIVGIGSREGAIEHIGHTGIDPTTSDDPRDMARRLVSIARPVVPESAPSLDPVEDEDPGELGVETDPLSESEATDNSGTGGSGDPEGGGGEAAYPGIAILPDELGARRNAVLAAIAKAKLTHLAIAMDPSLADFLAARFAEYNNAGALGLAIDDALAADYRAFQEIRDRRDRITNYAMQLEQSALDGDMDRLAAMHAGLNDGWP